MSYKAAVLIGRFQPPHVKHIETIRLGLQKADNVVVVIGSSATARTTRNPFTSAERESMIARCIAIADMPRVKFIHVRDHFYSDDVWVAEVQEKVKMAVGDVKTCLLGTMKDHTSYYLDLFPQWPREMTRDEPSLSATDIRELMFKGLLSKSDSRLDDVVFDWLVDWANNNLRLLNSLQAEYSYIEKYKKDWEAAPYPVTFTTTDAVVIKSGHILLIKRKFNPGKGLYALPGGFLAPNVTLFENAIKELKEETRIAVSKTDLAQYFQESHTFDYPGRSLRGRTITTAFYFKLPKEGPLPNVKGDDDAEGAMWVPLADFFAMSDQLFEDHWHIVNYFFGRS